jgi:hypothetical protein
MGYCLGTDPDLYTAVLPTACTRTQRVEMTWFREAPGRSLVMS